ncbi:MAG TPA: hypothetical protein VI895_03210 [Bdellovibrionota bacterium]|nr:hypothetical protein [Bdellovibrionota bacterium]
MPRKTLSDSGIIAAFCMALFSACGGSGVGGPNPDNPTPTPTATPVPPGGSGTEVIGQPGLCTAGDVARVDIGVDGTARFPLVNSDVTCSPAKDNRKEEYTLILYNTTASSMSFRIDSPINETPPVTSALRTTTQRSELSAVKPPTISASTYRFGDPGEMSEKAQDLALYARLNKEPLTYTRSLSRTLVSNRAISVNGEAEFRVRCNPDDVDVFCTTSGILRAQGDHINIFLDRDHPFQVAADAAASDLVHASFPDTLTSYDLDRVVQIFDRNIHPLETSLMGAESDVDGDSRVNVLITPIINRHLRKTATIGTSGYTDARNLLPFDPISNAGSNESEVIFVFAPDSLGNYSRSFGGSVGTAEDAATYVDKSFNAWIAFGLNQIISFNQHVLISGGSAEDGWIRDGIGTVMADLCGFNIWRSSVLTLFLSQPQLFDLRTAGDLFNANLIPASFMFMTYYLQSQVDSTVSDANGDGFDDDLNNVLASLTTAGITSLENLEQAADYAFDVSSETEFQSIFKDWTIALVTSGTGRQDLQQPGVTALKYYFDLNPSVFGTGIANLGGSVRAGADGGTYDTNGAQNAVGIDLNLFHSEEFALIENADEHVYAPGNELFGFIDPFAAMYVRLGGLFQDTQTISIKGSSSQLKGFLVRRSDISFPHVYSESLFGPIDQHSEDLDTAGPNPYWTGQGFSKKVDLSSLVATGNRRADTTASNDFLSIIGRIDSPSTIHVCNADSEKGCSVTDVQDSDKYIFQVPSLPAEAGSLEFVVRRQFDDESDTSALTPLLAIVSSKDVPYPYVPHPIRGSVVQSSDTRQQYRWLTSKLICGDGESTFTTNIATQSCTPAIDVDSSRIIYEGLLENTGVIPLSAGTWSGDIMGVDCDLTPDDPNITVADYIPPNGISTTGYGTSFLFGVTNIETSPSSLGSYPWLNSFMTTSYDGSDFPDVLFSREFIGNSPAYPSTDPKTLYDPRSINGLSLNCHADTGVAGADPDLFPESPDNFLASGEIAQPTGLANQILTEMSRGRANESTACPAPSCLETQYQDFDIFAIDGDSRDSDTECSWVDKGNNMNTRTVRRGEGSFLAANDPAVELSSYFDPGVLSGGLSALEPHIQANLNVSQIPGVDQQIYTTDGSVTIKLTPGKSYTLIVAGTGNSLGSYELRIRKIDPGVAAVSNPFLVGTTEDCGELGFEFSKP